MIELLMGGLELPKNPLLQVVTETKIEQKVIPELTVDEKIRLNYYKCDTDTHYIRADNAECLIKPIDTVPAKNASVRAVNSSGGNSYEPGQCTWGVKNWKPEVGNDWGNANNWGYAAAAQGWTVSSTPVVGAVAWSTRGVYGHVALVLGIDNDTVTIKEQNYNYNGAVRTTTVPVEQYQYIY